MFKSMNLRLLKYIFRDNDPLHRPFLLIFCEVMSL